MQRPLHLPSIFSIVFILFALLFVSNDVDGQCSVSFTNSTINFCANSDVLLAPTLNANALGQNPTYTWSYQTNASGPISAIANATANTLSLNNAQSAESGIYTLNVDYPASSSCADATASVTLNLITAPSINAGTNFSICQGQSANLSSSVSGLSSSQLSSVTYNWTSSPGSFSSNNSSPTFSGLPTGNTTFNVEANFEQCQFSDNVLVTVNANPTTPTFNLPNTGCPQTSIPLSGFNPTSGVSYTWNISGSGGSVSQSSTSNAAITFSNGGSYTVSVTATQNGCSVNSANDVISITSLSILDPDVNQTSTSNYLTPEIFDNITTYTICNGDLNSILALSNVAPSSNNSNTNYTLTWGANTSVSFNDPNNPIQFTAQSGNNYFTINASYNGCNVSRNFNIYVGSNPFVSVGVGSSLNLCPGNLVTASISPINQNGEQNSPGTTYDLYFSNNPNSVVQSFTDLATQTAATPFLFTTSSCGPGVNNSCFPNQQNVFYAFVVAENACEQSCASSPAITLNSLPLSGFTVNPTTLCVNNNVTITNTGTGGTSFQGTATTGYTCSNPMKIKYTISPNSGYNLVSGDLGAGNTWSNWTGTNTVVLNFSVPGTYTITQYIQSNTCGSSTSQKTICVIDPPTCSFSVTPASGCSPQTFTTTNNSIAPVCNGSTLPLAYNWTVTNPQGTVVGTSTLASPSFSLNNNTTSNINYTISLTVTPLDPVTNLPIGNCTSTCAQSVTVKPIPVMTNATSLTICSGSAMNFDLTSNISSTYSWNVNSNSNVSGIPVGNQTTDPIGLTLTNNTTAQQNVVFNITPTSNPGGCVGNTQILTVTVQPTPTITSTSTVSICDNSSVGLSLTSNIPSTFSWIATSNTSVNGEALSSVTGNVINNTLDNTITSNQTVTYTVTPTSSTGNCAGTAQTVTVTVLATPIVTNTNTSTICSGSTLNIGLTSNINSTFSWLASSNNNVTGESLSSSSSTTINNTLTNTSTSIQQVTYTITPTSTGVTCAGTPYNITVDIIPAVSLNPINPVTICNNAPLSIPLSANISSTFSWSTTSNSNITGESTSPVVSSTINDGLSNTSTSIQNLTYTITPTSSNGNCPGTNATVQVTVIPSVSVTSTNSATLCSGISLNTNLTSNIGSSFTWQATNNSNTTGESLNIQTSNTITDLIINNTTSAQTVTYTIIPISTNNNCVGTSQTFSAIINPAPTMTNANSLNVCSGSNVNLNLTSNIASTYSWQATSNGNVSGENSLSTTSNLINDILTNTTNSIQNVVYTITPNSSTGTCSGSPQTLTVSVIPAITITNTTSQNICSGTSLNYVFNPNIPATYSWSAASNSSINGESTTAQTSNIINNTLTNTSNTDQNVVYSILATSTQGSCPNPSSFTFTVTVIPTPTITNSLSQTICSGQSLNQTLTASYNSTFTWFAINNPNVTGENLASSSTTSISDLLTNNTNISQTVNYQITAISNPGNCSSTSYTFQATVNPVPVLNSGNLTICSGASINFTPTGSILPTGTTYSWSAPTNSAITGLASGSSVTSISATLVSNSNVDQIVTYSLSPTTPAPQSCTGSNFNVTVTIHPVPIVAALSETICSGSQFSAVPSASTPGNNITSPILYTWTTPSGSGFTGGAAQNTPVSNISQILSNPGASPAIATYSVTPTTSFSCPGSPFNVTVTVNPAPAVTFTPAPQSICSGATFSNITLNSTTSNVTYSWSASTNTNVTGATSSGTGNTITGTVLTNATNTQQTITYSATASVTGSSCPGSPATYVITINPKPTIQNQTITICSGSSFSLPPFNASTTNSIPSGTVYTWITPTPANTGAITGGIAQSTAVATIQGTLFNQTNTAQSITYLVTPNTANNCPGSNFNIVVTVNPTPVIPAQAVTICANNQAVVNFSNNPTTTILPSGTSFAWPVPTALGSITGASANSGQSNFQQTLGSTASTSQNITFVVTPSVVAGSATCTGTPFNVVVTVNPTPNVNAISQSICSGNLLSVTPNSGNIPAGTTYSWSAPTNSAITGLASGSSATSISATLVSNSNVDQIVTYSLSPTTPAPQSCTGSNFDVTVTIHPVPIVAALTDTICSGSQFSAVPSASTSGNNITNPILYTWSAPSGSGFSGGAAQSTPVSTISQILSNPGTNPAIATYSVTPTTSFSCPGSPFNVTVTVNPAPAVTFTPAPQTICSGATFSNITLNSTTSNVSYSWSASSNTNVTGATSSGTGNTITGTALTNATNTQQTITYSATASVTGSTCPGSPATYVITINPKPTIQNQTTTICSGSSFSLPPFNASTTNSIPSGTVYTWITPTPANTGAITGGTAQSTAVATIQGTLLNQTNTAQNITYLVTPNTANNCPGSNFNIVVTVNPTPVIPAQAVSICANNQAVVNFSNNPTTTILPSGTSFAWPVPTALGSITGASANSGQSNFQQTLGSTASTSQNITFVVTPSVVAGSATCTGTPFNVVVTVNPTPNVNTISQSICSGNLLSITPNSGNIPAGTTYSWSAPSNSSITGLASGSSATSISAILVSNSNVDQIVTYSLSPTTPAPQSCTGSSFNVTVTIHPVPIVAALTDTICSGSQFSAVPSASTPGNNITSPILYTWTTPSGSGFTGGSAQNTPVSNISQILSNPGTNPAIATYSVTPTTSFSCPGSPFNVTVTVNPAPAVTFTPAPQTICSGAIFSNITLNSTTSNVSFSWSASTNTNVTGATSSGTGNTITGAALTNATNTQQTITYSATASVIGSTCPGSPATYVITINPKPTIQNQTTTICSGATFSLPPFNSPNSDIIPAGTVYTWITPTPANSGAITGGTDQTTSTNIVQGTLINQTNTAQNITYFVTPNTPNNCQGSNFNVIVTVNPKPTIPIQTDIICGGETAQLNLLNNPPTTILPSNTTFSWNIPANIPNTTGATAGSASNTFQQTLMNASNTIEVINYSVTPLSGICTGTAFNVAITVNPTPIVNNVTQTICSGDNFNITPNSSLIPSGTNYTWPAPTTPITLSTYTSGTAQSNISGTLNSSANNDQTVVYDITPTSAEGCAGSVFTATVNVHPTPVVSNMTDIICSGEEFEVIPSNIPASNIIPSNINYTWASPSGSGFTGGSAQSNAMTFISQTLSNTTVDPVTANYVVTPSTTNNCPGTPFNVVVTINPAPTVTFSPAPQTICSGTPFNAITLSTSTANPQFSWSATTNGITGATTTGNNNQIASETLTNPTNLPLNVVYTASAEVIGSGCPGVSATYVVTVNPTPNITLPDQTICSGTAFSVTPTNGSGNIVPSGTTYTWPTPAINPFIAGTSSQNNISAPITQTIINLSNVQQIVSYEITPMSSQGCPGADFTLNVNVNPTPIIPVQALTICGGSQAQLNVNNNQPSTILPTSTNYTWSVPSNTFNVTGSTSGNNLSTFQQTLMNGANTIQTINYSVTPNAGACQGNPFNLAITVNPTPVVTAVAETICSGNNFNISPNSTIIPVGTTYNWNAPTAPNTLSVFTSGINQSAISGTLTSSSNSDQIAVYNVTPTSVEGCSGAPFSATITVHPTPIVANMTTTICSGQTFNVVPNNNPATNIIPANINYTWTAPAGSGFTGGSSQTNNVATISQSLNNTTVDPVTALYTVTPSTTFSCPGNTFTVTVTVNPSPSVTFSPNSQTICSGTSFNTVTLSSTSANVSYSWNANTNGVTGATSSGNTNQIISQTLNNPTNASINVIYTAIAEVTGSGCPGSPATYIITVNPTPNIADQTVNICSGNSFGLPPFSGTNIIPINTTYTWPIPVETNINTTTGAQGQFTASNLIFGTLINNTYQVQTLQYTVTANTVNNCASSPFIITVNVNPAPVIPDRSATICGGDNIAINFIDNPGNIPITIVPNGTTYSWNLPSTTGNITGALAANAMLNFSQTLGNTSPNIQTATYSVIPNAGNCPGAPFQITITINPTPDILDINEQTCSGVNFDVSPINGIIPIGTTYDWAIPNYGANLSGGQSQVNQTSIFGNLVSNINTDQMAVYTVTPTSNLGCQGDDFNINVNVHPTPIVLNINEVFCGNDAISILPIDNSPVEIIPNNIQFGWTVNYTDPGLTNYSELNGQANFNQVITNTTNVIQSIQYNVIPTTPFGCVGNDFLIDLDIKPIPTTDPVTNQIWCSLYATDPVSFSGNIIGTTYNWSNNNNSVGLGNNGVGDIASFMSINNTQLLQTAVVSITPTFNGCTGLTTQYNYQIQPLPIANFALPALGCTDAALPIANNSQFANNYNWYLDNNFTSIGLNPNIILQDTGFYNLSLVTFNTYGCSDTTFHNIELIKSPDAIFSMNFDPSNCGPLEVAFSNSSEGEYNAYNWDLDITSSTSAIPANVIFPPTDTIIYYQIQLTATNFCGVSVMNDSVLVNPLPIVDFIGSLDSLWGCSPLHISYNNMSTGIPDSYLWDYGDGITSTQFEQQEHVYFADSTIMVYETTLFAFNECGTDSMTLIVTVKPNTVSAFHQIPFNVGCEPFEVCFTDFSEGVDNGTSTYNFGNGESSSLFEPCYTYDDPGSFIVSQIVTNGCAFDTAYSYITVLEQPDIAVYSDTNKVCANVPVYFSSDVNTLVNYTWDFSDGSQSNESNPNHIFANPGPYWVSLDAVGANNCSASDSLQIQVYSVPLANFTIPTETGCSPFQLCASSAVSAGNFYYWDFGDGTTGVGNVSCHNYINPGNSVINYDVTLYVENVFHCRDTAMQEIFILPQPTSAFNLGSFESCTYPINVNTNNFSQEAFGYVWYINNDSITNEFNPVLVFDTVGDYNIDLVAINQYNCTSTSTASFEVHPIPIIDFTLNPPSGCTPLIVEFENNTTEANDYIWSMGDGSLDYSTNPTHIYEPPGLYDIQLIATNNFGCSDTLLQEDALEIYPVPYPEISFNPSQPDVYDKLVYFQDVGGGASSWEWNFGDGNYGYIQFYQHEYMYPATYIVTLNVQNEYGCTARDVESITIKEDFMIFVPNAFTPMIPDGTNDYFLPIIQGKNLIQRYKFQIFDRWGSVVFETNDPDEAWVGNYKGGDYFVQDGVYNWTIEVDILNGDDTKFLQGHVTIIR